jgi:hypothetical protein
MFRPKLALLAFCCAIACLSTNVVRAADSCQFRFLPARPGDISSQELDFLIDLKLSVQHADGELFRSQKSVERLQTRWTTVLEVDKDVVTAVAVRFDVASETQLTDNKAAKATNEPVAGKTYHIARQGEALTITNLDGKTPSRAELDYLTKSMDAVGRPNALARYLHGREMVAGQAIDLPKEISAEIFGFRDAIGEVASLKLTLRQVHRTSSGNYAILDAEMIAHSPEEPKLSMRIEGQMQVDIDTCRLVGFVWEGPVTLSEQKGEGAQAMTLNGLGTVAVEMRAKRATAWPNPPADYASSPSSSKSRK